MGPCLFDHATLIEPGKLNQKPILSHLINGRFRNERLNEHWFLNLTHAQAVIEAWRHESNEARRKKVLSGLAPSAYTRKLSSK